MPYKNVEDRREADKRYYKTHHVEIAVSHDRWKAANAERRRETDRVRYQSDPGRSKDHSLKRRYGISKLDFDAMLASQNGRCANPGCRASDPGRGRYWCVDHDHCTGRVRGILCYRCNSMLGFADDDPERLHGGISYLKEHSN